MNQVLIKNFSDYVNGREVEATASLQPGTMLQPGERVLAFKDSIAATTSIPVPREKQDLSIGIEGTVTQVDIQQPESGSKLQKLKVIKV
jgi:hypothetical protein